MTTSSTLLNQIVEEFTKRPSPVSAQSATEKGSTYLTRVQQRAYRDVQRKSQKVPDVPESYSKKLASARWSKLTIMSLLARKCSESGSLVFTYSKTLEVSAASEVILSVGNFKTCDPPHQQLYVLFGVEDRKLQLDFAPWSGKWTFNYRRLFSVILK